MGLLGKLFGKASPKREYDDWRDKNPVGIASFTHRIEGGPGGQSATFGEDTVEAEFEEFRRTFCHRPGENFWDFLEKEGVTNLQKWLRPDCPNPEPKAIIRLLLDMQKRGENLWDQTGVSIFHMGRWSEAGGEPTTFSQEALSVLTQIWGKPIELFYEPEPDGQIMVMKFEK